MMNASNTYTMIQANLSKHVADFADAVAVSAIIVAANVAAGAPQPRIPLSALC